MNNHPLPAQQLLTEVVDGEYGLPVAQALVHCTVTLNGSAFAAVECAWRVHFLRQCPREFSHLDRHFAELSAIRRCLPFTIPHHISAKSCTDGTFENILAWWLRPID